MQHVCSMWHMDLTTRHLPSLPLMSSVRLQTRPTRMRPPRTQRTLPWSLLNLQPKSLASAQIGSWAVGFDWICPCSVHACPKKWIKRYNTVKKILYKKWISMETSIYGHLNEEPQKNWLSHIAQRRSVLEKQLQVVQQRQASCCSLPWMRWISWWIPHRCHFCKDMQYSWNIWNYRYLQNTQYVYVCIPKYLLYDLYMIESIYRIILQFNQIRLPSNSPSPLHVSSGSSASV